MKCRECGNGMEDSAMFCGKCGAKVEIVPELEELEELEEQVSVLPNTCKACGEVVREGAKFCRHCGEAQEESASGEIGATIMQVSEPGIPEVTAPKVKLSGKNKKILTSILAVVALVFIVTRFNGNSKIANANSLDLIMFEQDSDNYAKSKGKEKYMLKGQYIDYILVSKDGKKIYSLDDDTLYLQQGSQDAKKIADDVEWFAISPLGNTVAFIKDMDMSYDTGALYVQSGSGEPEKVVSEDCYLPSIRISDNGKYVAFSQVEDSYDWEDMKSYLYPVGGDKISAGKELISIWVDDKGTTLGINNDQDLYITKKGKDSDKIISSTYLESLVVNNDFSKILVLDDTGNLYLYKGNDKEKVDSNVTGIIEVKAIKNIFDDGPAYQTSTQELDITYVKNGSTYVMFDGKDPERLLGDEPDVLTNSDDFKNFAYINNGALYIKRFNGSKLLFDEKVDSAVSSVYMDPSGKHIVYIKDGDLYYLAKGKKEGTKVETKDDVIRAEVESDGTILYLDIDQTLYTTKGLKSGQKIMDDISQWGTRNGILYMLDRDQTLYETKGNKKPIKIADDVTSLRMPEDTHHFYMYY